MSLNYGFFVKPQTFAIIKEFCLSYSLETTVCFISEEIFL